MRSKFKAAERLVISERLPGWEAFLAKDSNAQKYCEEQLARIEDSIRDDDAVRFERAVGSWRKAWQRINEILAEEYRQANEDPDLWELRYVKWMKKLDYIRLDSPYGEFFIVPRKPRRKPKVDRWYTVDEVIEMLNPVITSLIVEGKRLPIRAEALRNPGPGEKHLVMDFTGPETDIRYRLPKGGRRD